MKNQVSTPTINLAAVVEHNPLLACTIVEAALHAVPAYNGDRPICTAGDTCWTASIAVDFLAEATAARDAAIQVAGGRQAASQGSSSSSSRLEQQLFCLLVAALKYAQVSTALTLALTCSARAAGLGSLQIYNNRCALVIASSSAALRVLGDLEVSRVHLHGLPAPTAAAGAATQLSSEQQLLWFHLLGRCLIAAGQLLQQLPQRVSPTGNFVLVDSGCTIHRQYSTHSALLRVLVVAAMCMHSMLQQGGAATPADLSRLLQQAADLQQRLTVIHKMLCPSNFDVNGSWAPRSTPGHAPMFAFQCAAALQQLRAACTSGGLLQQLHSFGLACCAAFPKRGVCDNPACTNLERFTETALAS